MFSQISIALRPSIVASFGIIVIAVCALVLLGHSTSDYKIIMGFVLLSACLYFVLQHCLLLTRSAVHQLKISDKKTQITLKSGRCVSIENAGTPFLSRLLCIIPIAFISDNFSERPGAEARATLSKRRVLFLTPWHVPDKNDYRRLKVRLKFGEL